MIKRLLNPHILLKITLILTTLLLLPTSSRAAKYTTSGNVMSTTNTSWNYTWNINSSDKWKITFLSTAENGSIQSNNPDLQLSLNAGKSAVLELSRPTSETGKFRMVTLSGLAEGLKKSLTATVTFPNENSLETLTLNGESFEPSTPSQWGENDKITITLSNNTESSISCTISSITVLTGTQGTTTFNWSTEVMASPSGPNYDISEIVNNGSGNDVTVTGRCEQNATFRFPLFPTAGSYTIDYSSSNTSVAQVDNNGIVTVKSAGEATITATPEGDDYNYYLPSSYRLIIQDIYQFCDLIVKGRRVTTGNRENILKDANHTVTFDGNQTLTLNGANLNDDGIISSRSALTIKITGTNKITVSDQDEACIKSTNGGSIAFVKGDGEAENNLLLKHIGGEGRAIRDVRDITLGTELNSLPSYQENSSEWFATKKEIFITDKQIYDLNIAGTQVTEGNRNNVLNDGYKSVSYDPTTSTLTLKGANTDGEIIVGGSISTLNVHIVGYSQIGGLSCNEATTLQFTTSTKLPGKLKITDFSATGTVNYNNGLGYDSEDNIVSASLENIDKTTFTDGDFNVNTDNENGANSYIYTSNTGFYASYAIKTGKMKVVSPKDLGTTAALWPTGVSSPETLKKVYLQFDWGSCTNKSVTVQIKGLSSNEGVSDGKVYSNTISLSTADKDGIVEIPITGTITSENIELYFNSSETFSFVPLVVAMEFYETYGLYVGEVAVTEQNKLNVFGNGTVAYESETNTLTLNGANITSVSNDFPGILYYGEADLIIKLEGTNTMTNSTFTCNTDKNPYLNFIIDTDNPGTLTMTNGVGGSSSPSFSNVKSNFIDGFNIKYENATYDYDYKANPDQAGTYIGTYKISILKPSIWTSIERKLTAVNPMAETNAGTIKFSVVYADGTEGVNDQEYTAPYPLVGPATVTSYIAYANGKKSGTATGYYFGASPKTQKLVYGTEAPTLNLKLAPQVAGVSANSFLMNSYFVNTDVNGIVSITGVGRALGYAFLEKESNATFTNLADSIGFVLEVVPASPTFSVDAGTYNKTQKVTMASPYNDPNGIADNLGTGGSATISIKYYLGETKPTEPLTYKDDQPITISESTKLTAWVEVKYEIPYYAPDQSGSGVTTEVLESEAITKSYVLDRDIAGTTVTLADNNKSEFTYNEAANVPTITQVSLTDGTETLQLTADKDYTISYVKMNGETEEAIEADKIINAGSYKMILTGKGNFSGIKAVPFSITPRTITNLTFALSATSFTYNGEAQKPTVTVQFEETELEATKGTTKTIPTTDYDLTFSGECINAGTYSVSASLKGNYSGSGDGPSFTITKANITPKVTLAGWPYGATANTPSVSGNTGNGEVTYAYKLQNEAESAFTAAVPTNAGAYTVKASIAATANYEAASDTAQFTIAQAMPTLSFSTDKASLTMGEEVTGLPTLSNPGELAVTYASSDTDVATIEEDGTVKPVAPGTTTISATFAGNNNYEAITASYELTVNKAKVKTYGLWIGDTQVTEDNAEDILNATEDSDMPLYLFNAKNNTLIINKDQRGSAVIESRLPELKVYIMDTCMVKSIYYNPANTENTGTLTFTCNGNYPGNLTIANEEGISAIKGFSSVSYEYSLTPTTPKYTVYKDGQMMKGTIGSEGDIIDTVVADSVIIGIYIAPLTNGETNTVKKEEFEGVDVSNYSNGVFIFTLNPDNENPEEGDGIDTDENGETGIFVGSTMTDNEAGDIASNVNNKELTPGDGKYAEDYDGITFMVPAGNGVIKIDQIVDPGYEFHLKIGTGAPTTLSTGDEGRVEANVNYQVDEPTYCYLYMVEVPISARAAARGSRDTRLGKRDRAHGKIFSVTVSPNKLSAANTPAQASGGIIPPSEEQGDEIEAEGIQGVKVVNTVDDRWFTIDGRQIDKPTQKGLYIHNRKKVVVK